MAVQPLQNNLQGGVTGGVTAGALQNNSGFVSPLANATSIPGAANAVNQSVGPVASGQPGGAGNTQQVWGGGTMQVNDGTGYTIDPATGAKVAWGTTFAGANGNVPSGTMSGSPSGATGGSPTGGTSSGGVMGGGNPGGVWDTGAGPGMSGGYGSSGGGSGGGIGSGGAVGSGAGSAGTGLPSDIPRTFAPTPGAYDEALNTATNTINTSQGRIDSLFNNFNDYLSNQQTNALNRTNDYTQAGQRVIDQGTDAAVAGLNQAINPAMSNYNQITGGAGQDFNNYRSAINGGIDKNFTDFQNTAAYKAPLEEGLRAVTNNQAVSGMLHSGETLKALQKHGSDYASSQFLPFYNAQAAQKAGLANSSLGAVQAQGSLAAQKGITTADLYKNKANTSSDFYKNQGLLDTHYRLGTVQAKGDVTGSLAEAQAQAASALANTQYQSILGKGSMWR